MVSAAELFARGVTARTRARIVKRLAKNKWDQSVYISGKAYLLPLAHLQLKSVAGFNESTDKLKVRLAQHCELHIDRGLKRAVLRALR